MSELLRERQGHIEILTINRPEARNAINGAVSRAFATPSTSSRPTTTVWVVVADRRRGQGVLAPAWT